MLSALRRKVSRNRKPLISAQFTDPRKTYTEQRGGSCKADHKIKSGSTPEQNIGYHQHLVPVVGIGGEVVHAYGSGKNRC